MKLNELLIHCQSLNNDIKYILNNSGYSECYDLSELSDFETCCLDPDSLMKIDELRDVLYQLDKASDTLDYLRRPVSGEFILHKNSEGRYSCSDHTYTCGNTIEFFYPAEDEYDHDRWVISIVEYYGKDYHIAFRHLSLDGLRIRRRSF